MNRRNFVVGLVFSIACGFVLSPVFAEPFNDRGNLWTNAAPSGTAQSEPPVRGSQVPGFFGFNEGGVFWSRVAPPGSAQPRPPVKAAPEGGFIDRSHVSGYEDKL